ncbi:unnamed protein product, partial [Iphiclides podalirius]
MTLYHNASTKSKSDLESAKCCSCIPQKIGCFILAYLNLIFILIHTLTFSLGCYYHFGLGMRLASEDEATKIESIKRPLLTHLEVLLIAILCVNIVWLTTSVMCLVGLHKKRPGPIKVYITFVTARLIFIFSYLVFAGYGNMQTMVFYCLEIGLTIYFVVVYYIYAMQLKREEINNNKTQKTSETTFVYPEKIEKERY